MPITKLSIVEIRSFIAIITGIEARINGSLPLEAKANLTHRITKVKESLEECIEETKRIAEAELEAQNNKK